MLVWSQSNRSYKLIRTLNANFNEFLETKSKLGQQKLSKLKYKENGGKKEQNKQEFWENLKAYM